MGMKLAIHAAKSMSIRHTLAGGYGAAEIMVHTPNSQYAAITLFDLPAAELDAACLAYLAKRGWMFIPEHKVAVQARGDFAPPTKMVERVAMGNCLKSARAAAVVARAHMVATAAAAADAERAYIKAISAAADIPEDVPRMSPAALADHVALARATDPDG